ncbi:hypothetical protein KFU94_50135 [Chloroflexi bacterium TSY]|nr:hypothetical protein [Chloroflexi bacterium TSY]
MNHPDSWVVFGDDSTNESMLAAQLFSQLVLGNMQYVQHAKYFIFQIHFI